VVGEHPWLRELLTDVSGDVNDALDFDKKVLVEGTQGFGLSLYHSDYYPCTTSRDTSAAGFLSEVGVSPRLVTEIVTVFRTFPIRVAGMQAGPLKDEITWEKLREESGYPHDITEMTTVTHKIRRVGRFDWELAQRAVAVNRPTHIAINGLDYLNFASGGASDWSLLSEDARSFTRQLENRLQVPVAYCGTGPSLKEVFEITAEDVAVEFQQSVR
jgi:adenylosuccinate synthase